MVRTQACEGVRSTTASARFADACGVSVDSEICYAPLAVCELDLVFNFHKVYAILDEYIISGELQETSQVVMLDRLHELEKMMMT